MTRFTSWSKLQSAECEHVVARHVEAARRALTSGRRVVLRGAGLSFDGQSLDDDLALTLDDASISIDPEAATFTVGPAATWGAIVERLLPLGLCFPPAISASSATVAGTLSANAMSRFTPQLGKEGKWLESVDVLLATGESLHASRRANSDVFHALVGGWGGIGLVTRATYRAARVPVGAVIESTVQRSFGFEGLADALIPNDRTAYAIVSVDHRVRTLVVRSQWVPPKRLEPMLPHVPASPLRIPIEWGVNRWAALSHAFWHFTHAVYMRGRHRNAFVDDPLGYTFFMDGHVRAKRAADRRGVPFEVRQQSLIVPKADDLAPFLRHATQRLQVEELPISLLDVLWLPHDEPFRLSSTRASGGYACTFSFEGPFAPNDHARLARTMADLAEDVASIGGRVHLVKNVFARADNLARTYGEGLTEYAATKRRVDPHHRLSSVFLRRCFPRL